MVPQFNGGAYNPVVPNNGNPNTVYNTPKPQLTNEAVPYAPAFEQPLGQYTPQPEQATKPAVVAPTFAPAAPQARPTSTYGNVSMPRVTDTNADTRSPMAITLPTIEAPAPTLPRTQFGSGADYWQSRLSSLNSTLPSIPIPGVTNPSTPTQPTQPTQPTTPGPGGPGSGNNGSPIFDAPGFTPRQNEWGDPNFSFDRNLVPVRPVSGAYAPEFSGGFGGSSGSSGGTGGTLSVAAMSALRSVQNLFSGPTAVERSNESRGALRDGLSSAADALLAPGMGGALNWLIDRLGGEIPVQIAEVARIDPERAVRDMAREAMMEMIGEVTSVGDMIRGGQPVSDAQRQNVDQLRAQLTAMGFPPDIQNMSPADVRSLVDRATVANMVRDPNQRVLVNNNYRSIATGSGMPRGMLERLRGHTTANGRVGLMDAATEMEMEAVRRAEERLRNSRA